VSVTQEAQRTTVHPRAGHRCSWLRGVIRHGTSWDMRSQWKGGLSCLRRVERSAGDELRDRRGAPQATHRPGQAVRILRKGGKAVGTTLLVPAVTAFLALAIGQRLMGYQTLTMLTGSMAPLINPGDVVVSNRHVPMIQLQLVPSALRTCSIWTLQSIVPKRRP
jgi:hypothetical protein